MFGRDSITAPGSAKRSRNGRSRPAGRAALPRRGGAATPLTFWTIGHSNRTIEVFLDLLATHGIEAVADVRRFAGSRRLPQYGAQALADALARVGIDYVALPALGGRRRGVPGSVNAGWRNASFQAYADHLASEEFAGGLTELLLIGEGLRTAIMCSEALWWRCHRRLIADVLVALGHRVEHIVSAGRTEAHALAVPARVVDGVLTYPPLPGPPLA